ncbi:hypothetical protein [Eikenella corrodens]|uniref:Uncharacterized protein n=1 Tax=Eikenella corrodens TaxID=539 RepID=A0A3S9SJ35_EIKCO|nr:hypothetical protein [Eikenella corrodens]AZR59458.1 hypothetical protein ELB75_05105 [Eikenella corrodens]
MTQKNDFKNANFYGNTQIVNGGVHNVHTQNAPDSINENEIATYTPEPIWRSPITMAWLTWASFLISLSGLLPIYKLIVKPILYLVNDGYIIRSGISNNIYIFILMAIVILFLIAIVLRRITKYQTRYPLVFNYAISGMGHRIILEKISISQCPQCGGEMKYYNKPIEWEEIRYPDGSKKRRVTRTTPALECKRNREHWYKVDPAEDKI